jgi:predicted dinucleotide-binding enzyme
MKIGVLGTGQVGGTIGRKLARLGHQVMFGSRDPKAKAASFAGVAGLSIGTLTEAAAFGDWVVNALPGEQSLTALRDCAINGKILIDIANYNAAVDQPIEVPLGQAIQSAFPKVRLVKALNSVSAHLMADPAALPRSHSVFLASNDQDAKDQVSNLLRSFGWHDIIDLGDLSACRAMEQLIPLWMRLEATFGGPGFNLSVVRQ